VPIVELGHTGLWVDNLELMTDFYTRVLGLTVTDRDDRFGMVFLSSRPETEHHELVLGLGRRADGEVRLVHQVSWRVDSLETLREFHERFATEGVKVQQEVTHGNALGIYFFDPEGNRNEVYLRVDRDVRQPFRKSLDFGLSAGEIRTRAEQLLNDGGEDYQPVDGT
jgi:catechol-2,3-dioxygenase